MEKQCLYWKRVICKDVRGLDFASSLPNLISNVYNGNLLSEIFGMPQREPISFERAVQLVTEKRLKELDGRKNNWFHENFIGYISGCGYHIELTGDEFIFHLSSDKCA